MTHEQADALAQFVKDHDKRFSAAVHAGEGENDDAHVLLTHADDGTDLPPVRTPGEYQTFHIEQNDPGPTVRAAWEKWRANNVRG